ncbi:MAG TPA: RHS repeat-associated core domain-containing protein [Pyrinomonadaceae bacterium]|nr:RHS repeat-associated core domain-containing protein [Pyrinomonadaceae bacterium]
MKKRYSISLRRMLISGLVFTCALVCTIGETAGQNIQFTQGNVGSGLDSTIQIPIIGYPGRGASLPVNLYYSSKVWRLGNLATVNDVSYYTTITEAIYAEHTTAGWKTSLDLPIIEWPKETDQYYYTGKQFCFICSSGFRRFRVARVYITMPDGSKHELRESDTPYEGTMRVTGTFYAVDGSRLRYDATSQTTGTVYMPDGSRYVLNGSTAQFIDRNGNTLNYTASTRQWKDTLGREINVPLPASPTIGTQEYYAPGLTSPYQLVWKKLSDPGVITSGAGPKPVGSHYLPNPAQPPTPYYGNNYPTVVPQGWSGSLFVSQEADSESPTTWVVGRAQVGGELFDPVVLTEVVLPNGLKYKFGYNIYGEIDKITYPTGAYEQYSFDDAPPIGDVKPPYAQMNRVVTQRQLSAKGDGSDLATWTYSISGGSDPQIGTFQITGTTAPDNSYSEVRKHNFMAPLQPGQGNPHFWPFGWEDARQGVPFEERVYDKPPGQGGVVLRRSLTDFAWDDNPIPPRIGLQGEQWVHAFRNVRPKKSVSLILDTGGDALAKLITYGYNSNPAYIFTTGLDQTDIAETHFASVPQASAQADNVTTISTGYSYPPASSLVTTYLDDAAYQSRHILGLPTSVLLKNTAGQVISKSESFYDEAAYPLINYNDLTAPEYADPNTNARGNVTTTRSYSDIGAGLYLETHAQFDQCGNVRNTWNERGIQTATEYSSTYKHAYATQSITAVPDPTGVHGSTTAFTSSSTYDYTTGLTLTTTDANGQVTTLSYQNDQGQNDSMNRVRKVTRPDGSWSKYSFGETLGNLFTLTETQQDATRVLKAYEFVDPMGRISRSFGGEGGANYIATDTIFDQMGRVWKVSNPYRTTTLNGVADLSHTTDWTVSHYDAMSRVDYVTLPDASQVLNNYQGIYTTVTDQAGRQRRTKTDALGRIVRVDEPNQGGSLGSIEAPTQPTYYDYDTQGALIHITQGTGSGTVQHRYFKYDALGRLTHERQVEQAGTHTASDPLTGNSAWSRKLVYDETIGGVTYAGLLTSGYDARNIHTEFRYDNLNRIYQVSYSDSTPTVSNFYDQPATGYFNKGRLTQASTAAVGSIPATAQNYRFDVIGRVSYSQQTVGDQTYVMDQYTYNLKGALTSQKYPSGRVVSYAFDDGARLSQVSSGAMIYANAFDYTTTQGLLKQVTLGNGAVESFTYNSRLQIQSMDLARNGTQLQHYDYKYGVYNPATNIVDETKNTGQIARIEGFIATQKQWQQNFAYDSLGRLSSARELRGDNGQQVWLANYEYDVFGNRYQKQAQNNGNPFTQIWTEDADINKNTNRYASGLTYDDAGNVTIDSKFRNLSFQYDANNRQKQSTNGTTTVVNVYDAGGQRVATQAGGMLTNVLVYDAIGKLVAEYGPVVTGGTQFVTSDHQNSPRAITNATGTVISRHDYAPFGEDLPAGVGMRSTGGGYSQPDSVRQKYAGMENDEATGMSHTLWRQYDNLSARWTAPDPYGDSMSIASPQSFNRYSYVENDPVNKIDPLGLMTMMDATMSWQTVTDIWANENNFGGPETGRTIIENGMNGFADRDEEEEGGEEEQSDSTGSTSATTSGTTSEETPLPPPPENPTDQSGSSQAPAQAPAQAPGTAPAKPLTSVTVLGKTVKITYAKGISAANKLKVSNKIAAAAALINANASTLTPAEKKAIGRISVFSVVGSKTYLGATGSNGMTLSVKYILDPGSSAAWIASLFAHEGQHHLNKGKFSGKNLWKDELSARTIQLGVGNKVGFQPYETTYLQGEMALTPANKAKMQKHMEQGLKY